jgi:hypothetical protein
MATKKATKKDAPKASTKKVMTPEEKAAKKKARLEAIKNRPAEQRPNSKSIDVIFGANGTKVTNYGHPVKVGGTYMGVLVTSVVTDAEGNVIGTSTTFVPGELTIKSKKNHGNFSKPKHKKGQVEEEDSDEEGDITGED